MLPDWELIIRLLIAALLGSFIGFEREQLNKAAGLRTHMLVSLGSCLFMIVSAYGFSGNEHFDPTRIAAQVVSGIGFLGAGSILLRGKIVAGITTAASIWSVAAVGLAVGCGLYVEAISSTLIVLAILIGVGYFEKIYLHHQKKMRRRK
jgi:putative Mg2+ transporter-C (MgtC) family protein